MARAFKSRRFPCVIEAHQDLSGVRPLTVLHGDFGHAAADRAADGGAGRLHRPAKKIAVGTRTCRNPQQSTQTDRQ